MKPVPGNVADKQGWYGEETLDLEAVHSMAPGAKLVFLGAKGNSDVDILERANFVIDHHLASIVSNSYGNVGEDLPAADLKAEEAAYQQAIVEGIGFYFSSGDCGDELDPQGLCGGIGDRADRLPGLEPERDGGRRHEPRRDRPAVARTCSRPAGAPGSPRSAPVASTGTRSLRATTSTAAVAAPARSSGALRTRRASCPTPSPTTSGRRPGAWCPTSRRVGDPNTGFLVGETQTFPTGVRYGEYRLGGTSLSSPIFAGIMALANQEAGHDARLRQPAPVRQVGGTSAFHDIVDPVQDGRGGAHELRERRQRPARA